MSSHAIGYKQSNLSFFNGTIAIGLWKRKTIDTPHGLKLIKIRLIAIIDFEKMPREKKMQWKTHDFQFKVNWILSSSHVTFCL